MKCDEARALSTPALDNELTVEKTALFNSHIDECEKCRASWDSALHIRTGVKDILKSFPSTNNLESKIMSDLNIVENELIPLWKTRWVLAAVACILPMLLVASLNPSLFKTLLGPSKSDSTAQTKISTTNDLSKKLDSELTLNDLISKTSHADETPQKQEDKSFTSRSINVAQKTDVGFPLLDAKLEAYKLGGAEMLLTNNKKIVRMCFKTNSSNICVDCYQAPAGVISFNSPSQRLRFGEKQLAMSSVGNVNLVMFSRQGIDVVYASALPQNQLLKLVQPNA